MARGEKKRRDRSQSETAMAADRGAFVAGPQGNSQQQFAIMAGIIDGSPDPIAAFDPDFRYLIFNRAYQTEFKKVFGFEPKIGASLPQALAHLPEEQQHAVELLSRALGGEAFTVNRDLGDERLGRRCYELRFSPIRNSEGRLIGAVHVARDVTEKLKAEEALHQSEERQRAILDNAPVVIFAKDLQGRYTLLNRQAEVLAGKPREQLLGRTDAEIFPEAVAETFRTSDWLVLAAGHGVELDKPISLGNALYTHFLVKFPLLDAKGEPYAICGISADISSRKRIETALLQSEEEFRTFFETTGGAAQADPATGRFLRVNRKFCELTGFSAEELLGLTFLDITHPEDRARDSECYQRLLRGEVTEYSNEKRYICKDGRIRWVQVTISMVRNEAGLPLRSVGVIQDITGLMRAEEALRESEERLQLALGAAFAGAWDWDIQSNTVFWSPENYELYGIDPADASSSFANWERTVHPDDLAPVKQAVRDTMERRTPVYRAEFRVLHPTRGIRWILGLGRMMFAPDGTPLRMSGINIDVTERKQAEEALLENEERLRLALESGQMGLWEWDVRTGHSIWNAREYELLGLPPGDGHESPDLFFRHVHPDDVPEFQRALGQLLEGLTASEYDFRIIRADGQERWLEGKCRVYRNAAGQPERMVGVNYDITERKRIEEKLYEQARALAETDRRKDEFLAMLAHELRNPLAPIRSAIHVLRIAGAQEQVLRRQRDIIDRQVTHMARLLDDLLDVSRITRGKIELNRQPLHLTDVLVHAVETATPLIEARHHKLALAFPPDELLVEADLDRLAQAVGNLLSNAAKYTGEGGQIWLEASRSGDQAIIRVRDTGVGLASEMLPRVFDLFTQVEQNLARSQGGLGIGLTMVKNLVEMHGGTVAAHSGGLGKGSEFVICLPALPDEARAATWPEEPQKPTGETPARRILLVDDVQDTTTSLAELLELWGHEVRVAYEGPAALETAHAYHPQVVLLDIGLPGMDGYEVARRLRKEVEFKSVLLIALTGYVQPGDRELAYAAGFDHHLVKPVDLEALRQLLGRPIV